MKKIVKMYYEEQLALPGTLLSGFVFELEDGCIIVHAQEGSVRPTEIFTDRHVYDEWFKAQTGSQI